MTGYLRGHKRVVERLYSRLNKGLHRVYIAVIGVIYRVDGLGLAKMRGTVLGVPMIRILLMWGLY